MATLFAIIIALLSHADTREVESYQRVASNEYRLGIPAAIRVVDPAGDHPEWEDELWRICRRESWCGRYRAVAVHDSDGWTGASSWLWAAWRGQLDPTDCADHRLETYAPVRRALDRWELAHERERPEIDLWLDQLAVGEWSSRDFATRGGFGRNAARDLRALGSCAPPSALDDPARAALAAAKALASCKADQRPCTCVDHTRSWMGAGVWAARPLITFDGGKSRARSVLRQCGRVAAFTFVVREIGEIL